MKDTVKAFQFIPPDTVKVDNITLTYSPKNEAEKKHILHAIENEGWQHLWVRPKIKKGSSPSYLNPSAHYYKKAELLFPDPIFTKDNEARLEMSPRNPSTPFLRLDYNPEKISFEAISTCLKEILPQGVDCIFDYGKVTRLDIAVDIRQVFPYQIILDYIKTSFRTVYLKSGAVGSIYIGKDTGESQMYMYDKVKEMKDKGYQIKPLSDYQFPTDGLTRIEIRHRPKKTTFADLFHLPNLFAPMYIVGTPPQVKGDTAFNVMRDLCVHKGLRHTVNKFPKAERLKFADKLEEFGKYDFLDIHKLWGTLPDALLKVYPHFQ